MHKLKKFRFFPERFGVFPYIFLIYLIFPGFELLNESGLKMILGSSLLLLFFITYRQLYFCMQKPSYSYWLATELAIILVFSLFYDPNYLFLGFFPANFIGWYNDKRKFNIALIGLIIVEAFPLAISGVLKEPRNILYFIPFLIVMLISPFGVRSMNKRMELEKQLDQANEQIKELVKREERVRIARDLHDTLGHTLSLITLKSQLVGKLTKIDPARAQMEAKEIEQTSRAALKQVREIVSQMRAIRVKEELREIQETFQTAGISYRFQGDADLKDVPLLTQNIISMCLKEAATNVVKHSKSKNCFITISPTPENIKIMIKDDGIGLANQAGGGNGIKGMEERLALIDGTMSLTSLNGVSLEITIPLVQKKEKEGAAI
ncbi:sensor histidine kinase [Bacillus sp. FJAT-49736]|uniref:sensor histidine kinase n=1 Tax=Bacillus sp. FJAT-49736 TaxID=2833582 RepID=UPI001BC91184|nr:sensor histidine kinase [Bacillus sp. FJAT-49736]MBS4174640.1 sensor histidine kinase [Bacillus sp. FJAT-49736]